MLNRRGFLAGSVAATLVAPLAEAQPSDKVARIGILRSESRPPDDDRMTKNIAALRAGLQDEGYAEGEHYRFDYRVPKTEADVAKLAQAMVRDQVDVIHAAAF